MKHQIQSISVNQSAKTLALVYFIIGFVYVPFGYLADAAAPPGEQLGLLWFLAPVAMLIVGYIAIALFCALYNFVAGKTGGVEVNLSTEATHS